MTGYFRNNLVKAVFTSPFQRSSSAWKPVPLFFILSLAIGFGSGLLRIELLNSSLSPFVPFIVFIFPALLEELFFRGILIPRDIKNLGLRKSALVVIASTLAFVLWHPLNAYAWNHNAITLFTDPRFLLLVAALGLTCGYSYIESRSIWVPVIIHWLTVTVWVLFLGGRNLVLEL